MVPRFVQLVILAGLMLLIPSLLYLSHSPRQLIVDPKTGLAYSADSVFESNDPAHLNPLAQVSQGNGVESSPNSGWTWKVVEHQVGDRLKGFVDGWRSAEDASRKTMSSLKAAAATISTDSLHTVSAERPKDTIRVEGVIMPKMGNDTAKAALGRSTWHFLHTMTLRFPDKPTKEESETLRTFFANFALLYPCGECAHHFQRLVSELPPQTASRMSASLWLCAVHNEVNKSLGKDEFPCDKLDESYDCGCGEDPSASVTTSSSSAQTATLRPIVPSTSTAGS